MDWSSLLQPQATILAAFFGLAGVVVGWFVNALVQSRLERIKAANARSDVLAKELSAVVQQLAIHAAAALHSMCWLTWLAEKRPGQFAGPRIDSYNTELHGLLPKLSGYLTTIAALDPNLYAQLYKHIKVIYDLDEELGQLGLSFTINSAETTKAIGAKYNTVQRLEKELGEKIANVLRVRIQQPD